MNFARVTAAVLLLSKPHIVAPFLSSPSILFASNKATSFASFLTSGQSSKRGWAVSRHNYHSLPMMTKNEGSTASSSPTLTNGLFLFDFDGVVCDSCDECTVSAWRTCRILNAIEGETSESPPQWLFEKMREIRPAIEVGWQIPVLLSVFLEQQRSEQNSKLTDNFIPSMSVPEIIENYESLVDGWLDRHKLYDKDMIETFGKVRDDWIANDYQSWLDINTFYDGISEGITSCKGETVLVTTKQHRFATALVRHAGIGEDSMPDDDIYGLGMYKSKSDVIVKRMKTGSHDPTNTHFFEDRWPTLEKCLKDERLEHVKFYLCSWGYCTKGELGLAEKEPRVEILKLEDFSKVVV